MALSGEAFGERHPATFDQDPFNLQGFNESRPAHVGQLSGEAFGEDKPPVRFPAQSVGGKYNR